MAQITIPDIDYNDKDNTGLNYPESWWRSVDAMQVKTKCNEGFNILERLLYPPPRNINTSTYDVLASDVGLVLVCNVSTSIILPDRTGDVNSDAIMPGTNLTIICNADNITVDIVQGGTTTIVAKNGYTRMDSKGSACTVIYTSLGNYYNLFGDLVGVGSGSGSAS